MGLSYLTLSRAAATLSGGEAQRIRLATQIGSSLMGVLYILDEPSIGLHQRDNAKLLATLKRLRDLGNTLIVVEHDEDTMYAADYIVDVGPGAGIHGGEITAAGTHRRDSWPTPAPSRASISAANCPVPVPKKRRKPSGWLTVRGAKENNLKNIDVKLPLGVFCCVTGVSGSRQVQPHQRDCLQAPGEGAQPLPRRVLASHDRMEGVEQLDKIIAIDQSPIGRTPRSNPATYTGLFDLMRARLCHDARRQGPRLQGQPLQLQRQGRPLRSLRRRRSCSRSRCTSFRTSTCPATCARARATTAKPLRCATRARTSTRCWR